MRSFSIHGHGWRLFPAIDPRVVFEVCPNGDLAFSSTDSRHGERRVVVPSQGATVLPAVGAEHFGVLLERAEPSVDRPWSLGITSAVAPWPTGLKLRLVHEGAGHDVCELGDPSTGTLSLHGPSSRGESVERFHAWNRLGVPIRVGATQDSAWVRLREHAHGRTWERRHELVWLSLDEALFLVARAPAGNEGPLFAVLDRLVAALAGGTDRGAMLARGRRP